MNISPKKTGWHRFPIHSFRSALIVSFLALIVSLLSVLLYYIFGVARKSTEQTRSYFEQTCRSVTKTVLTNFQNANNTALRVGYSDAVQKYLLTDDPETVINSRNTVSDLLSNARFFSSGFRDIVLFSENGRILSQTLQYHTQMEEALRISGITAPYIFNHSFYTGVFTSTDADYLAWLSPVFASISGYHAKTNRITLGVIYSLQDLEKMIALPDLPSASTVLYNRATGKVLYESSPLDDDLQEQLPNLPPDCTTFKKNIQTWTSYRTRIQDSDLDIIYLMPLKNNYSISQDNLPVIIILIAVLLVTTLMYLILFFTEREVRSLVENINTMDKNRQPVKTPDISELAVITNALNTAFYDLQESYEREQTLIQSRYEAQLVQNRAELLAYRSQINPHFLFNTLETVRSLAQHYHVPEIVRLINGMSTMFKASLYSPMVIPLKEELAALDGYLSVIDVRFPGRYHFEREIAPETLSHPVLSVLLQPLIENTIQHAFTGRSGGTVMITTEYEEENEKRLCITITDDGVGMTEAQIESIVWKMKNSEGDTASIGEDETFPWLIDSNRDISIGLTNIYRRLKLTFGEHAHINLSSVKDRYTRVEILIPFRKM